MCATNESQLFRGRRVLTQFQQRANARAGLMDQECHRLQKRATQKRLHQLRECWQETCCPNLHPCLHLQQDHRCQQLRRLHKRCCGSSTFRQVLRGEGRGLLPHQRLGLWSQTDRGQPKPLRWSKRYIKMTCLHWASRRGQSVP